MNLFADTYSKSKKALKYAENSMEISECLTRNSENLGKGKWVKRKNKKVYPSSFDDGTSSDDDEERRPSKVMVMASTPSITLNHASALVPVPTF